MKQCDLVIYGGSNLALATALIFNQSFPELDILVIEGSSFKQENIPGRSIAINQINLQRFSQIQLGQTNLLQLLAPHFRAIKQIFVKEENQAAIVNLEASKHKVPQFGGVIHLNDLNAILLSQVEKISAISFISSKIQSIQFDSYKQVNHLTLADDSIIASKLTLVAAGEQQLKILTNDDIEVNVSNSSAIVAEAAITTEHKLNHAIEYFTPHGPVALLPQNNNKFALVWCDHKSQIEKLTPAHLIKELNLIIQGLKLNYKISHLSELYSFPLVTRLSKRLIAPNLALIGNSATQVHPISGQGYNLGLDSVYSLLAQLEEHNSFQSSNFLDPLYSYQDKYILIRNQTYSRTTFLESVFRNEMKLVQSARSFALSLTSTFPVLSDGIVKASLGISKTK